MCQSGRRCDVVRDETPWLLSDGTLDGTVVCDGTLHETELRNGTLDGAELRDETLDDYNYTILSILTKTTSAFGAQY